MKEFEIRLRSVQDVQGFVSLATTRAFTVLVGNDERHLVNGKSFMEMFSLDFTRPLTAAAECSNEEFCQLCAEATRFLAKK